MTSQQKFYFLKVFLEKNVFKKIHDENPNLTISQLLGKLDKLVLHPMTLFLKSLPIPPYIKLGGGRRGAFESYSGHCLPLHPESHKRQIGPSEKFWRKFCEFGA